MVGVRVKLASWLLAVTMFVLGAFSICSLYAQKHAQAKALEKWVGRRKQEIEKIAGPPGRAWKFDSSDYPEPGYGRPRPRKFATCYGYFTYDLLVYLYFDKQDRCVASDVVGG